MDRRLVLGSLILGAPAVSSRSSHANHLVPRISLANVETIVTDDREFDAYIHNMWLLRDLLILLEARNRRPRYSKDRSSYRDLIQKIERNRDPVRMQIENQSVQRLPDLSDAYRVAEEIQDKLGGNSEAPAWRTLVLTFLVCNCILVIAEEGSNLFCDCYPFSEWGVCADERP